MESAVTYITPEADAPSPVQQVALPQTRLAQSLIGPDISIHTLTERFTAWTVQIGLVVDKQRKLISTVTDGDIRRGLLRGISADAPVHAITNPTPRTIRFGEPRGNVLAFMRRERAGPRHERGYSIKGRPGPDDQFSPRKRCRGNDGGPQL